MNPKVDTYLRKAKKWQEEMGKLRKILLSFPLTEELKWGKPCYMAHGKNVVVLVGFKNHCALIFCKGALLDNAHGMLIKPGENTQAARQARFTSVRDITVKESILKACLHQAIEVEKAGLEVEYKKPSEHKIPEELQRKFEANPAFKKAFQALTPGRQRLYLMHFSSAKQSQTREARIEKCTPDILMGIGFNERYRS